MDITARVRGAMFKQALHQTAIARLSQTPHKHLSSEDDSANRRTNEIEVRLVPWLQ